MQPQIRSCVASRWTQRKSSYSQSYSKVQSSCPDDLSFRIVETNYAPDDHTHLEEFTHTEGNSVHVTLITQYKTIADEQQRVRRCHLVKLSYLCVVIV